MDTPQPETYMPPYHAAHRTCFATPIIQSVSTPTAAILHTQQSADHARCALLKPHVASWQVCVHLYCVATDYLLNLW